MSLSFYRRLFSSTYQICFLPSPLYLSLSLMLLWLYAKQPWQIDILIEIYWYNSTHRVSSPSYSKMEVIDHTKFKEKFLLILLEHQNRYKPWVWWLWVCVCECGCECLCMWINKRMFKHGMSNFRLVLHAIISLPTAWQKTKKKEKKIITSTSYGTATTSTWTTLEILYKSHGMIIKPLKKNFKQSWLHDE